MTMPDPSTETNLLVAFARLEGKVDLTLTEIGALKQQDADHELRIRNIEALPIPDPETERRIRAVEDRRTISPGQLWAGLIGVTAFVGTLVASINGIVNLLTP